MSYLPWIYALVFGEMGVWVDLRGRWCLVSSFPSVLGVCVLWVGSRAGSRVPCCCGSGDFLWCVSLVPLLRLYSCVASGADTHLVLGVSRRRWVIVGGPGGLSLGLGWSTLFTLCGLARLWPWTGVPPVYDWGVKCLLLCSRSTPLLCKRAGKFKSVDLTVYLGRGG